MAEHHDIVPSLPPNAPRVRRSAFVVRCARAVLRIGGWRMIGEWPDIPRLVMIGAPHSSNWDGVWAFAALLAMQLDVRILGKDSLFRVPLLGPLLRQLGVMPVDRQAASGVVAQASGLIRGHDRFWYGLAPEGTRRRVERWKPGFWYIAVAAGVPILPVYFDYPKRIMGIGPLFHPGTDKTADIERIRDWYRGVSKGRNRDA